MSNGATWGKKEAHCTPEEAEYGDTWDHVAMDPTSKLVVSLAVGERTQEQTMKLVQDAQSRLAPGCLPAIFTDAYEAYPQAILEAFGNRYQVPRQGSSGRRPKPRLRRPQGLVYAQVKKHYRRSITKGTAWSGSRYGRSLARASSQPFWSSWGGRRSTPVR